VECNTLSNKWQYSSTVAFLVWFCVPACAGRCQCHASDNQDAAPGPIGVKGRLTVTRPRYFFEPDAVARSGPRLVLCQVDVTTLGQPRVLTRCSGLLLCRMMSGRRIARCLNRKFGKSHRLVGLAASPAAAAPAELELGRCKVGSE